MRSIKSRNMNEDNVAQTATQLLELLHVAASQDQLDTNIETLIKKCVKVALLEQFQVQLFAGKCITNELVITNSESRKYLLAKDTVIDGQALGTIPTGGSDITYNNNKGIIFTTDQKPDMFLKIINAFREEFKNEGNMLEKYGIIYKEKKREGGKRSLYLLDYEKSTKFNLLAEKVFPLICEAAIEVYLKHNENKYDETIKELVNKLDPIQRSGFVLHVLGLSVAIAKNITVEIEHPIQTSYREACEELELNTYGSEILKTLIDDYVTSNKSLEDVSLMRTKRGYTLRKGPILEVSQPKMEEILNESNAGCIQTNREALEIANALLSKVTQRNYTAAEVHHRRIEKLNTISNQLEPSRTNANSRHAFFRHEDSSQEVYRPLNGSDDTKKTTKSRG